jgi:chromosome segregation and condensation protein ScpB
LYGVTDQFLDYFGLKSIDDLPKIEYTQDDEESELFTSKYTE